MIHLIGCTLGNHEHWWQLTAWDEQQRGIVDQPGFKLMNHRESCWLLASIQDSSTVTKLLSTMINHLLVVNQPLSTIHQPLVRIVCASIGCNQSARVETLAPEVRKFSGTPAQLEIGTPQWDLLSNKLVVATTQLADIDMLIWTTAHHDTPLVIHDYH